MRPLERLPTIRAKLGSVIVFAVALTLLLVFVFVAFALRNSPRDSEVLALLDAARKAANGKLQEIPPNTMVVFRSVDGGVVIKGRDLKTDPPVFDDEQAHWGIINSLEYVAVPRVNDGFVVGTDYVMRPAPDLGLAGSFDATLGFLQQQWWQLLVAGVIAALFSLLAARVLALGMTQPLRDMVRAAKKMAVGDYSARIDTRSVDEVGQLADAFNRMSS
ncbi:MAG: HAMP domain-containing protein, partial [Actinobacteria bacterium]|nr:HAMP domain-containing protein [Actinomycetota bacterium]